MWLEEHFIFKNVFDNSFLITFFIAQHTDGCMISKIKFPEDGYYVSLGVDVCIVPPQHIMFLVLQFNMVASLIRLISLFVCLLCSNIL